MSFSTYFNPKIPIFKGYLVTARRNAIKVSSALVMTKITTPLSYSAYSSQTLTQLNNPNIKDHLFHMNRFDESCTFTPIGCNPDQINNLIDVFPEKSKHQRVSDQVVEEDVMLKEMKELMERLERVMERFRVLEMEKLMGRAKGGISDVEREEAEMMSRDIINKFLEKPMQYLNCEEVKLVDKLQDLKLFVGIFESSCLEKKKNNKMTSNNQCLRDSFT